MQDPKLGHVVGEQLYTEAKRIIPGGVQLLSKRPEMYAPGHWPAYFVEAKGVEITDVDGRRFVDMTTMGVGTCLLGYADADVNEAVERRLARGSTCTLNSPDEPALARALLDLHPWAHMARFARTGGEAMSVAIRIARARTGRDLVAFCGYHGWHDWYLAANLPVDSAAHDALGGHLLAGLTAAGVPRGLAGTCLPFAYNNVDELRAIAKRHGANIAAIVMEPTRTFVPLPGFLAAVRDIADQTGAVLIFDEITSGFRLHHGGAHQRYGIAPDIAVFAKALGNGIPIAAIIGCANAMQAAQDSFISSTLWTEGLGFAAGLATLQRLARCEVSVHVEDIGTRVREGLVRLGQRHGVPICVKGHPAITIIEFAVADAPAVQTLFTILMLRRGFLAGSAFYPSLAHEVAHVDAYLAAADDAMSEVADAFRRDNTRELIGGRVKHSGFTRIA